MPVVEDLQSSSFLQGGLSPEQKLERARTDLLDLSARNRLLNIPRSAKSARVIEVVDEKSSEIYRILVTEGKTFTFLPGRAASVSASAQHDEDEITDLAQPDDDSVNEHGVLSRHVDTKLQTKLTSKGLQRRLLELYFDARTLEEEQGVNILFLVLGTLKWVDPSNEKNIRYAPLVLVPVNLERGNAAEQFKLKWRQEDVAANLSLEAYLERVHSLTLPVFETGDELNVSSYIDAVADAVKSKINWSVQPDDIVLGLFSFAKFLMYRDLDPAVWAQEGGLLSKPLISGLLSTGFSSAGSLLSDEVDLDACIPVPDLTHIVDCDSSQALAVNDVRKGHNLVIQGPPGTGKSQTIANVIASAIADGKTVLFVAEKMAALEVVKRRLDHAGVGDACLELHSNKANKRILLEELRRTFELGPPKEDFESTLNARLEIGRALLNAHARRLHRPHDRAGLTPYQVIGELVRLQRTLGSPVDLQLANASDWTADGFSDRLKLVRELAQRITDIGVPDAHPWHGVGLNVIFPTDVDRSIRKIIGLSERLSVIQGGYKHVATRMQIPAPSSLAAVEPLVVLSRRIASAPPISGHALAADCWETAIAQLDQVIAAGVRWDELAGFLSQHILPVAWNSDVSSLQSRLELLPDQFDACSFAAPLQIKKLLPGLLSSLALFKAQLGWAEPDTIAAIRRKISVAERITEAPDVGHDVLVSAVWDQGVEQAAELADNISILAELRARLSSHLTDAAWDVDLAGARQTLAMHGQGLFRFFSSDWRRANSYVKSFLKNPSVPLPTQLELLDSLAQGQKCRELIIKQDDFGRAAFGPDWRSERSSSEPLKRLVEWMRSLRGLGNEPRLLAVQVTDKGALRSLTSQLKAIFEQLLPLVQTLWRDADGVAAVFFPNTASSESISIDDLVGAVQMFVAIDAEFAALVSPVPATCMARRHLLAQLDAAQGARRVLDENSALCQAAFGDYWQHEASNWQLLAETVQWVRDNADIRKVCAAQLDRAEPYQKMQELAALVDAFLAELVSLQNDLKTNSAKLFDSADIHEVLLDNIARRFTAWVQHSEQLSKWVAYKDRAEKACWLGLGDLVGKLESGQLQPVAAEPTFEMAYYESLFRSQLAQEPELGRFDGALHGRHVAEFVTMDRQRIKAASLEVVKAHYRRMPKGTGAVGPLGVLRGEMVRRRGHMPIRQLMAKAAPAVQALKPVMMMSPLSVAQFLPPGKLTFDLLVMDEASQIQPVDALGAVARCRQVVVVGDERQLPPTKFFSKVTGQQDDDDGDEAQVSDVESILGLFSARGLPQRMLRWHYRSRHQSLIAVSNSQFYENKLFIVPSPYTHEAGMGLLFRHLPEGVFDSGNTGTNQLEAAAIAEAIIKHARVTPELSLGVATFSVRQRKAILDQLEVLRRQSPDTEGFFSTHPSEPFFVKNLENVQGDERDVIFISVGYGKNAQGYMAMRFGPLSADGGERRLNVLISRAKRRCEIFSSITDEDIDLERGKGKGVFAFKLFLRFARTGKLDIPTLSGRDYDSGFEAQVAQELTQLGYKVHPQVGIAGFFIDLAVVDPDNAGRYLLGIECDGASYHSSRSARDRDRLRQAVLEDHGWVIHRIWSTEWFQRPKEQLQTLVTAIQAAKAAIDVVEGEHKAMPRTVPKIVTIDRGEVTEIGLIASSHFDSNSVAYVEASPAPPVGVGELHEAPDSTLADLIRHVALIEAPVHVDEIVVRLRSAWGLKRAGGRIQAAIERGMRVALQVEGLKLHGGFISRTDGEIVVRDRSAVKSDGLRKPEMLPPQELDIAIEQVVQKNFGATVDEIVQTVARRLGYKATSSQLRERIQSRVDHLTRQAALIRQGDNLVSGGSVASPPIQTKAL
ncbi:DUF3320 domain-containing protein [Oxalobacteraceae bacterium A2-2]